MLSPKLHAAALALMVLALPASAAHACGCGRGLFGSNTTYYAPYTAGYAPYVANYAPAGCGQVVNYMPQTYYRTVYVNAPVMAYSPVTACNACGGATTVMRPVTTYITAARLVPYTTYSPVVMGAAPACGGGCGAVAPATAYYAPPAVAPAAPACCGASYAPAAAGYAPPTAGSAPAAASYAPPTAPNAAPATGGAVVRSMPPQASVAVPPATTQIPAIDSSAPANPGPQRTFEDSNSPATQPESRVVPRGDDSPNSSTSGARRIPTYDNTQDRTTALPVRQAVAIRTVSAKIPTPAVSQPSNCGWRASRD